MEISDSSTIREHIPIFIAILYICKYIYHVNVYQSCINAPDKFKYYHAIIRLGAFPTSGGGGHEEGYPHGLCNHAPNVVHMYTNHPPPLNGSRPTD